MDKLWDLNIHETLWVDDETLVLCVYNGWIYKFYDQDGYLICAEFVKIS